MVNTICDTLYILHIDTIIKPIYVIQKDTIIDTLYLLIKQSTVMDKLIFLTIGLGIGLFIGFLFWTRTKDFFLDKIKRNPMKNKKEKFEKMKKIIQDEDSFDLLINSYGNQIRYPPKDFINFVRNFIKKCRDKEK